MNDQRTAFRQFFLGGEMKKILLTGGGTAGHVMPHLALLPHLKEMGCHIDYIGSHKGIEKELIEKESIPYYGIPSGKLRRYFDLKNFTDLFRITLGIIQATYRISRLKPDVVFSKGGFVTVPVVIGAWLNRVPVVIHESDMTPGLANRIALKFARKACVTFEQTLKYLPKEKAVYTGAPIREVILKGDADKGRSFAGFEKNDKATLLITGGSLGSKAINKAIRSNLDRLLNQFNIIHLCGKNNLDASLGALAGYAQYEFVGKELPDLFALTNFVVCRAGSNTITELLALKKPNILIPLTASQSRGDQIINARVFEKAGYSVVIEEEYLTDEILIDTLDKLLKDKDTYIHTMSEVNSAEGVQRILDTLVEVSR